MAYDVNIFMARRKLLYKFLGFFLILVGVLIFSWWIFVCWILRDGIGPDMVTSTGWLAVSRILGCVCELVTLTPSLWVALLILCLGGYLLWKSSNRAVNSRLK